MSTQGPHLSSQVVPIEQIIRDAKEGKMFILIDHEDRENEGDLIIPAQSCNAQAINFMATYGRGLICLALSPERVDALGLPLMSLRNASRHGTAFTLSIEAREGISTGISAADRARTISTAIDPSKNAQDLVTPGHIFPLRARKGGVLVRAGHTESAVDISRLAGLDPSGVICEIMNDDGTMARLPDLIAFSRKHQLNIGTIADLIAYRRRHDNLVHKTAERMVDSEFGDQWKMCLYTDVTEEVEHIVLIKGDISVDEPVLVRMHRLDPLVDVAGLGPKGQSHKCADAMRIIAQNGRGVVVLLRDMGDNISGQRHEPESDSESTAHKTLRQYGIGAQILTSLGLHQLILLSDSPQPKIIGLEAYDLSITRIQPLTP